MQHCECVPEQVGTCQNMQHAWSRWACLRLVLRVWACSCVPALPWACLHMLKHKPSAAVALQRTHTRTRTHTHTHTHTHKHPHLLLSISIQGLTWSWGAGGQTSRQITRLCNKIDLWATPKILKHFKLKNAVTRKFLKKVLRSPKSSGTKFEPPCFLYFQKWLRIFPGIESNGSVRIKIICSKNNLRVEQKHLHFYISLCNFLCVSEN